MGTSLHPVLVCATGAAERLSPLDARSSYDVLPVAHYQQLLRGLADPRVRFAPPGALHDHEVELNRHAVCAFLFV